MQLFDCVWSNCSRILTKRARIIHDVTKKKICGDNTATQWNRDDHPDSQHKIQNNVFQLYQICQIHLLPSISASAHCLKYICHSVIETSIAVLQPFTEYIFYIVYLCQCNYLCYLLCFCDKSIVSLSSGECNGCIQDETC